MVTLPQLRFGVWRYLSSSIAEDTYRLREISRDILLPSASSTTRDVFYLLEIPILWSYLRSLLRSPSLSLSCASVLRYLPAVEDNQTVRYLSKTIGISQRQKVTPDGKISLDVDRRHRVKSISRRSRGERSDRRYLPAVIGSSTVEDNSRR